MSEQKIVYILGPMRGHKYYNFPAFDEAAKTLLAKGYTVVNPAALDRQVGFDPFSLPEDHDWTKMPTNLDLDDVITRDVSALRKCNAFFTLPGWQKSIGGRAEKSLLDWQGADWLNYSLIENFMAKLELAEHGKPKKLTAAPTVSVENFPEAPRVAAAIALSKAQEDETNPKDRLGLKKPPLRLLPWVALLYLSKVMALGAAKYGEWNWRKKKVRATVYDEAALRHLSACMDGQDLDEESGLPHEAHVIACMAIKLDARACGALIDDRHPSGVVAPLIKSLTQHGNQTNPSSAQPALA